MGTIPEVTGRGGVILKIGLYSHQIRTILVQNTKEDLNYGVQPQEFSYYFLYYFASDRFCRR